MYKDMSNEPNMTLEMLEARNSGGINLLDGRNASDLTEGQQEIIDSLPQLDRAARNTNQREIEGGFVDAFFAAAKQTCGRGYSYSFLTQSASLSTDFATRLLASRHASVIMVEPFLDYMRDILDRHRVRFEACDEEVMFGNGAASFIRQSSAKAVFLCTPNNPTGKQITEDNLRQIADACAATGKILMIDATFRLFDRQPYDQYKILLESRVSFCSTHLHIEVVVVDGRAEFDFLQLDNLLLLLGFDSLLVHFVFVFAVIKDLANRRFRIRGDFNKVEAHGFSLFQRSAHGYNALHFSVGVDETNFFCGNIAVDARSILGLLLLRVLLAATLRAGI